MMKRIILLTALLFFSGMCCLYAQTDTRYTSRCAIYVCYLSHEYIIKYNKEGFPLFTEVELQQAAQRDCAERCGSDCTLYYSGDHSGWWAIIFGNLADGSNFVQAVHGSASKEAAEEHIRQAYVEGGGVDVEYAKVYAWEVPSIFCAY
jgi:hypothetical protein